MPDLPRIPVICGPTGSGKTSIAVSLASLFPIEIVSADSRQVIRHLNIGTAKPSAEEQGVVKFHLIDLIEPGERYSAYRFIGDADAAIADIVSRERIPLVVGGTGLYLQALVDGVVEIESENTEVRAHLQQEMNVLGPDVMHQRLAQLDPEEAQAIHPNNRIRVMRALEIFELTGQPKSKLMASGAYKKSRYEFEMYCLLPERAALYAVIERRVDQMMRSGWLDEVNSLVRAGLGPAVRTANVIGYGELLDHVDHSTGLDEAVARIKQNTRRYAKRQITWFRHQLDCTFFDQNTRLKEKLQQYLKVHWENR